jgi:hydroxymethylbilane synthase
LENKHLKIGTRGSKLALWQAHFLQESLNQIDISSELVIIKTQGDKIQDIGFDKMEGKGFFTKEIEEALIDMKIDVAVHSMKDMPTDNPEELVITAISDRANPADWMLIKKDAVDFDKDLKLKANAIVGSSSSRRKGQILGFRPDLQLIDLRGNVPTRVNKLRTEKYDAIILAAAGLERLELDLSEFTIIKFNPAERTNVERKVLNMMDGSCHLPIGVYCERDEGGHYHVWASYGEDWQKPMRTVQISQSTSHHMAERIVEQLKK